MEKKLYRLLPQSSWKRIFKIELSQDQKLLLKSKDDLHFESKLALLAWIESESIKEVSSDEQLQLEELYESKKPAIQDGDFLDLISVETEFNGSTYRGILNYRLNGQHVQKRF